MCRNFGKELVILFHRSTAAPCGHVASIIKKSPTGDSLSFGSTPTTVCIRYFSWQPLDGIRTFGTFHHRDPRATNARAELKGTGHIQLSCSRHFICKHTLLTYFTHFTHKPYQTHFTLHKPSNTFIKPYNLHKKPYFILHLELFLELSFVNSYNSLFIPFDVKNPVYCCCCCI